MKKQWLLLPVALVLFGCRSVEWDNIKADIIDIAREKGIPAAVEYVQGLESEGRISEATRESLEALIDEIDNKGNEGP